MIKKLLAAGAVLGLFGATEEARAAFPNIVNETTTATTSIANVTNHTVNLPVASAGDLYIGATSCDASAATNISLPAGWTEAASAETASGARMRSTLFSRVASGDEPSTITITTDATENCATHIYVIRGGTYNESLPFEFAAATLNSNNTAPNPPELTPTGGAQDYTWLLFIGYDLDADATISAFPSGYGNTGQGRTGTTGSCGNCAAIGWARREANVASEDPAVGVLSASTRWVAFTVAVHPVEGAPGFNGAIGTQAVTEGVAYSQSFNGYFDNDPTSYALSCSLPLGLSFNTTTATISGTSISPHGADACVITASNSNGSVDSNAFNLVKAAPVGYAYQTVGGLPWAEGTRSVFEDASLSNGDIVKYRLNTIMPAYSFLLFPDGTFLIPADGYTGFISFEADVWDADNDSWFGLTPFAVNNSEPVCSPESETLILDRGQSINLASPCSDADGHSLAYTSDAHPPGMTLNASTGAVTGAPNQEDSDGRVVSYQACDQFACASYIRTFFVVDNITVPDCDGMAAEECWATLDSNRLTPVYTYAYSDTVEEDFVISIVPSAGATVTSFTEVTILVSMGPEPEVPPPVGGDGTGIQGGGVQGNGVQGGGVQGGW